MHKMLKKIELKKAYRYISFVVLAVYLTESVKFFKHAPILIVGISLSAALIWLGLFLITVEKKHQQKLVTSSLILTLICLEGYYGFVGQKNEWHSWVVISCFGALLPCITFNIWLRWLIVLCAFFIPCTLLLGSTYYGLLDKELVFALLQTNTTESFEYLTFLFEFKAVLIVLLCLCVSVSFLMHKRHSQLKPLPVLFIAAALVLGFVSATQPSAFNGIKLANQYLTQYHQELDKLRLVIERRNSMAIDSDATTPSTGRLHLLVIGESLSRFHMHNYGYRRDTTPWLSSRSPIQFEQAYSNHTHTLEALSLSLTQSNQYNQMDYFESASLISLLNNAGYKTAWISNQISAGEWDNQVSALAHESDYVRFINTNVGLSDHTYKLDMALVDELDKYLGKQDLSQNHFIVLHMMGSHISYCHRTKGVERVLPPTPTYLYLDKQNDCYDETVVYADSVLKAAFDSVSNTPGFSTMTFFSDHGEEVFQRLGHDAKRFRLTMSEIPLLVWTSEDFDTQKRQTLESNRQRIFTNDLIFDLLLSLTNTSTSMRSNKFDISSSEYGLSLPIASTLHNKIALKNDPLYVTRTNLSRLNNLMAHRVNTIGALDEAHHQGFERIELDLWFDKQSQTILVGHDQETLTGISLEKYLKFESHAFESLWLDFKNIDASNFERILQQLNVLDRVFDLKVRSLLETSSTLPDIATFDKHGWTTSYYLPTAFTTQLQQAAPEDINNYKTALHKQLKKQQMHSLSFDASLLAFVEAHFIDDIVNPLQLELNTWVSFQASDTQLIDKLNKQGITQEKINHIVVPYQTRFKL